jgi:hypothetical protein
MITLTLYSRPGCHLCEVMSSELAPLVRGRAYVTIVDISEDEELERQYGERIPVLAAGEDELSAYRLDAARVIQFLSGATS